MSLDRPVFILGAHKSGSSLLRNLLDGHSELFVLPLECHFFQMARYWVDYRLRRTSPEHLSYNEIKQSYIQLVEHYNNVSDPMADANLVGRINVHAFQAYLLDQPVTSLTDLICEFAKGLHIGLYNSSLPDGKRVVEKSVEHAEFAVDLKNMFPDAKFIHIVRNPYANLVALRRYQMRRKSYPLIPHNLSALKNSFYYLYRNQRQIEPYLVVRYEDVLLDTKSTMMKIANFIGINYDENLIEPTSLGSQWEGNSSRNQRFDGVSSQNMNLWQDDVNHFEIHLVNQTFEFVLQDYGYEKILPKHNYFLPVSGEKPKTYLINRIASQYI